MTEHSWNFSEWENALGVSPAGMDDEMNGSAEIKLSNRLYKVILINDQNITYN